MFTILLVEDNELNREMLSRRLERKGYRVVTACNGQEGVDQAHAVAPNLILMDMSMPVLNGWEATRLLRTTPNTRSIPIIALTAHAMVGDRQRAVEAGCNDYEMKPVDLPRLLDKLHSYLNGTAPAAAPAKSAAPSRPAPVEAKPAGPAVAAAPSKSGAFVLVVDDNEMNCDLLSRRLQKEGYRVAVAQSGNEALDWVRRQSFDLVLLDVMMPEINGLEVLRILRGSYSINQLPVIMVTAKDQSDDLVSALEMGANDYVTKPLNYPVLLARMQTQLRLKQGHAAASTPAARALPARPATPAPAARGVPPRPAPAPLPSPTPPPAWYEAASVTPSLAPAALLDDPPSGSGDEGLPPSDSSRATQDGAELDVKQETWADEPATEGLPDVPGYEVQGELGRGGMGVVYKARHLRMNRVVALKVIGKEHISHTGAVRRFQQEIKAAAQLSHPNIVMAFDASQFGDMHYFAMEYIEGVDLNYLVKKLGPLPVKETCLFIRQTALGLQHAHERGLVHRDVKPSNLFVTWTGRAGAPPASEWEGASENLLPHLGKATVKILDLGLALLHQPVELGEAAGVLTREERLVGTADYMAPEQWMNAHKVDIRADLYSLGCTFYHLLTGELPFPSAEPMEKMLKHHLDEPTPVEQLRPDLPPKVVAVLRRLMAKKPEDRFQTPGDLAALLHY